MFNLSFIYKGGAKKARPVQMGSGDVRIVIGLGNPGEKYKNTYHNVGFLFLDYIASQNIGDESGKTPKWKNIKSFGYTRVPFAILIKPLTFMNNSGIAAREAVSYFKSSPEKLLIVHDDSDIALGEYKLSEGRGAAGHKGVESVMRALKTRDIPRLRIGVRTDRKRAGDFVLQKISKEDREKLGALFSKIEAVYRQVNDE
jgi:peptidyl-tRNA hydrolase, PTH1 family